MSSYGVYGFRAPESRRPGLATAACNESTQLRVQHEAAGVHREPKTQLGPPVRTIQDGRPSSRSPVTPESPVFDGHGVEGRGPLRLCLGMCASHLSPNPRITNRDGYIVSGRALSHARRTFPTPISWPLTTSSSSAVAPPDMSARFAAPGSAFPSRSSNAKGSAEPACSGAASPPRHCSRARAREPLEKSQRIRHHPRRGQARLRRR